jgi:uncharacterized protein YdcH (DUF465 family)
MEDYERARITALLDRDKELDNLWREHLELEKRLAELDSLPHLTPPEELERKRLQKVKLAGKDRIATIVARYSADL